MAIDLAKIAKEIAKKQPGAAAGARMSLGRDSLGLLRCAPTGFLSYDWALGRGGYPDRRGVILHGPPSSGKCLPSDAYIASELGVLTVGELFGKFDLKPNTIAGNYNIHVDLTNRFGEPESTTSFSRNGVRPLTTIRLEDGTEVRSTSNHPWLVMEDGYHRWRQTKKIEEGDYLVAPMRVDQFGEVEEDDDVAYFYGVLIADGHFGTHRVQVCNDDPHVQENLRTAGVRVMGVVPHEYPRNNTIEFHFDTKSGVEALYARCGFSPGVAANKNLPLHIRSMTRRSLRNVLRGYFDCEGHFMDGAIEVVSASRELILQVKLALQMFGVSSTMRHKKVAAYPDNDYWRMHITGEDYATYVDEIGTASRKVFPGPRRSDRQVPTIAKLAAALYEITETTREDAATLHRVQSGESEIAATLLRWLDSRGDFGDPRLAAHLRELCGYRYLKVVGVERNSSTEVTFDFTMERTSSFIANGVVSHNSTMALHNIANLQKLDPNTVACIVETEQKADFDYAVSLGCDPERFYLIQPATIEDGYKLIEQFVVSARADIPKAPIVILWDSAHDGVSERSDEAGYDGASFGPEAKAYTNCQRRFKGIMSRYDALMIMISQHRHDTKNQYNYDGLIGVGSSMRHTFPTWVVFRKMKVEKGVNDVRSADVEGTESVEIEVVHNQAAPPHRKVSLRMRYGKGFDPFESLLEAGVEVGVIARKGAYFSFLGESFAQGHANAAQALEDNPEFAALVEEQVRLKATPAFVPPVTAAAPQGEVPDEEGEPEAPAEEAEPKPKKKGKKK